MESASRFLYGEQELRALAAQINQSQDAVLLFGTDNQLELRRKALELLARAEIETGLPTNAVTGHHAETGLTVLAFRDPSQATRAEVYEELRHLEYAREGRWRESYPGVFTALQLRELDAAAHLCQLWRSGEISQSEFDETILNLAHHLGWPHQPLSPSEALRVLETMMP